MLGAQEFHRASVAFLYRNQHTQAAESGSAPS
jgi:hypothetical protein